MIPRDEADGDAPDSTSVGQLPPSSSSLFRLAVLLSGAGRTLENLLQAIAAGDLHARVVVAGSSIDGVRGLTVAEQAGIPTFVVNRREHATDESFSDEVFARLEQHRPDLIVLSGFLRRLVVPEAWAGRMLNIHPALLPGGPAGRGFYGERVHAAVLASGAVETGATVHVVDNEYDAGPVVDRIVVPVLPDDNVQTLAARVFAAECALYPRAIARYLAEHRELFRKE